MDYTKNYHLPQWILSDRIMMEDFNEAMAGIEKGLTGLKNEAQGSSSALSGQIDQVAQDLESLKLYVEQVDGKLPALATKTAVQSALFRLAYNLYYRFQELEKKPHQTGVFHQSFAEGQKNNASGFLQMTDRVWVMKNASRMTLENIRPSMKEVTRLTSTSDTASITFTSTGVGRITRIWLFGSYQGGTGENFNSGKMFLRLYNAKTGTLETEQTVYMDSLNAGSAAGSFRIEDVDVPLHGGVSYRLELQIETLNFQPNMGFNINGDCMLIESSVQTAGTASVSYRFQEFCESAGGLILVQYRDSGHSGNSMTLNWAGQTIAPARINQFPDGRREAQFQVVGPIPADCTAALRLQCAEGGGFALYHWGGVLIG